MPYIQPYSPYGRPEYSRPSAPFYSRPVEVVPSNPPSPAVRQEVRPGSALPELVVPGAESPGRRSVSPVPDIKDLPIARTDQQFSSAVERAARRGVPLVVTFTDSTNGISGEELRLLAAAKAEHGQKAEVLLVDRSKLQANSELAKHFESYVARNGYPVTMLAKPSEGLKPSDLRAGSSHVADCRYGADCMMTAKLDSLQRPGRKFESTQPSKGGAERPAPPPTDDAAKPAEKAEPAPALKRAQPRSFDVCSQEDYRKVLETAGNNKEPVVALFYSSTSPHSRKAVEEYMKARSNVPGATFMAYDVDQLDKMSPADRQNSAIASYADYVRRDIGYPTTMIVPIAPPQTAGGGYSPDTNSATFRGGASSDQIDQALGTARERMSRFKFPEAPKPPQQDLQKPHRPSGTNPNLPDLQIRYA